MPYDTTAGIPTRGGTYAKLCDHLREAEDCCNMMAHLIQHEESNSMATTLAKGWLGMGELLHRMIHQVTALASNKLN